MKLNLDSKKNFPVFPGLSLLGVNLGSFDRNFSTILYDAEKKITEVTRIAGGQYERRANDSKQISTIASRKSAEDYLTF